MVFLRISSLLKKLMKGSQRDLALPEDQSLFSVSMLGGSKLPELTPSSALHGHPLTYVCYIRVYLSVYAHVPQANRNQNKPF